MKKLLANAMRSWITSGVGAVLGVPEIWLGLEGLFDDDPETGIEWKMLVTGIVILVGFLAARDGNKSSEDVKAKA